MNKRELTIYIQKLQIDNMIENDIDYWYEMKREAEDIRQAIKYVNNLQDDN